MLPSFTDLFFMVLAGILTFTAASSALLADADTGWHIRNGEFIIATRSVPHSDMFSYTRAGQPWYAWEWLYDAVIAAIHHFAGLNGVVFFTAVVIALTYALLFQLLLRRSGNFAAAIGLTLLAGASAQLHMLARPHVITWLFTLLWVDLLYRFEEGEHASLWWLPPLMLLWVNLHGGFILGLALLALFGCARIWKFATHREAGTGRQILYLAMAFAACLTTTLLTPYGYKLHIHIYEYLSTGFFMSGINEFLSPDFHASGVGYFEAAILLSVFAIAVSGDRLTATDLLVVLFSLHAALYAKRNIPLSVILICFSTSRLWAGILSPCIARDSGVPGAPSVGVPGRRPPWLRRLLESINDVALDMAAMERQLRGHGLAIFALAASTAIMLNGGRLLSAQAVSAQFSEKNFPVKATEFIREKNIHDHLFNPDHWSGYLIYRLYPETKVFFDDRHDFYGEAFVQEYVQAAGAGPRWRQVLDKYEVKWVLLPADNPLVTVLKESQDWRLEYADGMAAIYSRPGK